MTTQVSTQRYLVTSALPYANGPIHLGHVAGAYLPADIFVRYLRAKQREVVYICGTDEYGTAITETARQQGRTPQEVADRYHAVIRDGFAALGISFDHFSRTTAPIHTATAQEFFTRLHDQGRLYAESTEQLYDPVLGKFLADRQVRGICYYCGNPDAAGDQCEKCGHDIDPLQLGEPRSVLTGATPERRQTRHWYFPLGDWQPWLQEYIASRVGWRTTVLQFCRGWFGEELRGRAVTRDLDWGIPVPLPDHEGKVLYVWFDAPIGYISATREWAERIGQPDRWREFWCDKEGTRLVHFIGKDNTFFHALLFPAMCAAHGDYVIATDVPANEFLNLEGEKFSTSRGWAIWLHDVLERWPRDAIRFYLTTILPETADGDWQWSGFRERVNGELNNNFGNFVQRTLKFIERAFERRVPEPGPLSPDDEALLAAAGALPDALGGCLERYEFRAGLRVWLDLSHQANGYFQSQRPWELARQDPPRCATVLWVCAQVCRTLAITAQPFIPDAAQRLWSSLGFTGAVEKEPWDTAGEPAVPAGQLIGPDPQPLFEQVPEEAVAAEVQRLEAAKARALGAAETEEATVETISYEQFRTVDLRTATVMAAERVEGADKLLRLTLDVGGEERQIVAGLAPLYTPEELVGLTIVIVANLAPRKVRGVESHGMLLAADDGETVSVLTVTRPVRSGAEVR